MVQQATTKYRILHFVQDNDIKTNNKNLEGDERDECRDVGRRAFLKGAASGVLGSAGLMAGLSALLAYCDGAQHVGVIHEVAEPEQDGGG